MAHFVVCYVCSFKNLSIYTSVCCALCCDCRLHCDSLQCCSQTWKLSLRFSCIALASVSTKL